MGKYKEELIINRKFWLVPENFEGNEVEDISKFYDKTTRTRCCLGFYARKHKYTNSELINGLVTSPSELHKVRPLPKSMSWLVLDRWSGFIHTSTDGGSLMLTNDDEHLTSEERERGIKELFANNGVKVTFIGEYRKKKLPLPD